jgi:hypothetical protein
MGASTAAKVAKVACGQSMDTPDCFDKLLMAVLPAAYSSNSSRDTGGYAYISPAQVNGAAWQGAASAAAAATAASHKHKQQVVTAIQHRAAITAAMDRRLQHRYMTMTTAAQLQQVGCQDLQLTVAARMMSLCAVAGPRHRLCNMCWLCCYCCYGGCHQRVQAAELVQAESVRG